MIKHLKDLHTLFRYPNRYFCTNLEKAMRPIVISGPSAAGKTTLIQHLFVKHPYRFRLSVSTTTRPPRPGEVDGVHYFFVTKEEFAREIEKSSYLEYCIVHGNYYGTLMSQMEDIIDDEAICVLDIDVQGVKKVCSSRLKLNYIFVLPPSIEILRKRLAGRGTETKESFEIRMANAGREIEELKSLDVGAEVLINDSVEDFLNDADKIIDKLYNKK